MLVLATAASSSVVEILSLKFDDSDQVESINSANSQRTTSRFAWDSLLSGSHCFEIELKFVNLRLFACLPPRLIIC